MEAASRRRHQSLSCLKGLCIYTSGLNTHKPKDPSYGTNSFQLEGYDSMTQPGAGNSSAGCATSTRSRPRTLTHISRFYQDHRKGSHHRCCVVRRVDYAGISPCVAVLAGDLRTRLHAGSGASFVCRVPSSLLSCLAPSRRSRRVVTNIFLLMVDDGIDDDAEVVMAVEKPRMTMMKKMMKMVSGGAGAGCWHWCLLLLVVMLVTEFSIYRADMF